jgi:Protein of unknown function (DUF2637)
VSAADRAIRISATAAVLGVAGIAAYISYWHAYEVISAHGESGVTARLEPATIDGLVYCSSMVVLYAARHRLPVPRLARCLLALGIIATLAANLAHGWSHGPIGATVAAWPAASLVGSYELLLWLIRTPAAGAVASEPAADLSLGAGWAAGPAGTGADRTHRVSDNGEAIWSTVPGVCTIGEDREEDINMAAVAAYRTSIDTGRPLSERKLAAMFGKTSRRWARSRMAEARQPRLLATDADGNTQPVQAVVPDVSARKTVRFAG